MKKQSEIKLKTEYSNFFLNNDSIYTTNGNIFGQILDERLNEIKEFSELLRTLNLQNKYIYFENYSDNNREGYLFSTLTNTFIELIYLNDYKITFGNDTIFLLTNRKIPETLLFDIDKKQVLWKQDKYFSFQILDNELLIDIEKNKIIRYDFQSGQLLWQYHLPETYNWLRRVANIEKPYEATDAEIVKILGVYSGVLYIVLNSGRIVGLEENTGQEVFSKIEPDQLTLNYENERIYTPTILWLNTQLDVENGIIFGLLGDFYAEIDLKNSSKEYKVYDIGYQSNTKKIKCTNWGVWQGDEIFFGETNFAKEPARVGIFNRKAKQVTWTSDELGDEGVFKGLRKIDYAQNKLYILDMESTLHIFER